MTELGRRPAAPAGLGLVQSFVNTLDVERGTDLLGAPEAAAGWLADQGLLRPGAAVSAGGWRACLDLREALRALLRVNAGGPPAPDAAAVLHAAAQRAGLSPRFGPAGSVGLVPAASGLDAALGQVLAAAEAAMRDRSWARLKLCAEHGCEWAFFDASKNRSGRWCSMAVCGNRQKSRRAYRRRTAAAS